MANQLINATGLDGPLNWTATSGVAVHEQGQGAPGRIVFAGNASIVSDLVSLAGRPSVWAMAHYLGTGLQVRFTDLGGAVIQDIPVPMLRAARGVAAGGRSSGFNFAKASIPRPSGATHFALRAVGTTAVRLLKPYASADGLEPCLFQPGPHANVDLNYPAWPADLPMMMDEGLQADPIPTRKGFSGDSGVEATRRITRTRRYRLSGQLSLTGAELDRLMDFFDATPGSFWFTRPDTRQVCLAQWLSDGEPVMAGQLPGRRMVQVKLQLKVP